MAQKKVQILLSAYNGEKYIRTQLDSILAQTWENLEILVRDDGSSDQTLSILSEYEAKHPNVKVYREENIGLVQSFLKLLTYSDADYIGFSDQDDYWLPEKVERAAEKLSPCTGPALYCSNQKLVDDDLKELPGETVPEPQPGFGNAVIESMCTGCTVLMNRELRDIVVGKGIPAHAIWHDWWCYMVATYLGTMIFDKNAYILYRQHADNELGSSRSAWQMIKNKWDFLKKTRGCLGAQLKDFQARFRGIPEKDALVDLLLASEHSIGARWKLVFKKEIYRQKPLDQVVVRFLYLCNKML